MNRNHTEAIGRKRDVLKRHERHGESHVRRGRRAMISHVLRHGTVSADDVRAAVELPDDVDPRCLGSVPRALANAGIIRRCGFVVSQRPERNGSYIASWMLADKPKAVRWLADHPDEADDDDRDIDENGNGLLFPSCGGSPNGNGSMGVTIEPERVAG